MSLAYSAACANACRHRDYFVVVIGIYNECYDAVFICGSFRMFWAFSAFRFVLMCRYGQIPLLRLGLRPSLLATKSAPGFERKKVADLVCDFSAQNVVTYQVAVMEFGHYRLRLSRVFSKRLRPLPGRLIVASKPIGTNTWLRRLPDAETLTYYTLSCEWSFIIGLEATVSRPGGGRGFVLSVLHHCLGV